MPPKRLRLLAAFHHRDQRGEWRTLRLSTTATSVANGEPYVLCHNATQTDELWSTAHVQPVISLDWEHEENFSST
jgi:hypothetical protein